MSQIEVKERVKVEVENKKEVDYECKKSELEVRMKGQSKGKRKETKYVRIEGRGNQSGKQIMSEVEYYMKCQRRYSEI